MIVTIEQIHAGLIKYIDNVLAAKANSLTKFMIYFYVPSLKKELVQKYEMIKTSGTFAELLDENGNINIDLVYERAKDAMKHTGKLMIPGLNYFADEDDLTALYTYIRNS